MSGDAPRREGRDGAPPASAGRILVVGSWWGLLALASTAAVAEVAALAVYVAAGRPFRAWSFAKIGWLYLLSFSRVGLEVRPSLGAILGSPAGNPVYRVHVAFLLGTVFAGWVLFWAGASAARRADGGAARRALTGALIAPGYALPAFLLAFAATIRLPQIAVESLRPIAWQALVFPLAMAATVGAAGGLRAWRDQADEPGVWGSRLGGWATGGCRMLVASVGFALVGLLVLATLHPAGVRSYVQWHQRSGRTGAIVLVNEALALPNVGVWLATPSMGGCDVVAGTTNRSILCPNGILDPSGVARLELSSIPLPRFALLFLLVPVGAALVGGATAARGARSTAERSVRGLGAGVVFAALAGGAAWLAGVGISGVASPFGGLDLDRIGPRPGQTAALALAWGVVGGVVGALVSGALGSRSPATSAQDGEGMPEDGAEPPEAPLPPRPTSV